MPYPIQFIRGAGRRSVPPLLSLLAALWLFAGPAEAQAIQQWRRWEKVLTSTEDYTVTSSGQAEGNPYRDLTLIVTYKEVATQKQFSRYGFWDGGRTFKIRGAFPGGNWTWSTTCSGITAGKDCKYDTGLNASGSLSVASVLAFSPCPGPGPCYSPYELYNRGFPAVSADGRSLTYAYGATPFFWSADTAWQAPVLATTASWQTYLSDRLSRGFTAILLALAPDTDWTNPVAFGSQPAGCSNIDPVPNFCSIPLRSYWQAFDEKVQMANQSGLLVFIAGLNDPMDRGGPQTRALYPRKADVERFARHLGARLAGNFVVYSGSFDDGKDNTSLPYAERQEDVMKAGLAALFPSQPSNYLATTRQLRSIHLGGGANYSDYAAFQGVVDVQLFHSGHGSNNCLAGESRPTCALRRAREMPLTLGNYSSGAPGAFATLRPAGNVETLYESDNFDGTGQDCFVNGAAASCLPQEPDTPNRVRQAGHLTSLSGAFGSTTGSGHVAGPTWMTTEGIYPWVFGPAPNDFASYLNSPGAGYMKNLRALFATRPWKDLRPQHCVPANARCGNLIVGNDSAPGDQKAVIAVATSWRFAIAYMPNNASLTLDTQRFTNFSCAKRWTKKWWNPRDGMVLETATPTSCSSTTCSFNRPRACLGDAGAAGGCDWALILDEACPTCTCLPSSAASSHIQVGLGQPEGDSQSGIVVELEAADGSPLEPASEVSSEPTVLHKLPRIARGRSGSHLVVWQSENLDGSLWGVFARHLDSNGLPLGEPFQVNSEVENDQTDPAVTETAGKFVVTWSSLGQDGDLGGIFAQRIDAVGELDGPEFQVNSTTAGHQGYPQIGVSNSGDFVVAWESGETGSRSEAIYAQRFDKYGTPLGGEIRVDAPAETFSDLVTLTVAPLGNWSVETQRYDSSGADLGRFLRRFSIAGQPVGAEVEVFPPAP